MVSNMKREFSSAILALACLFASPSIADPSQQTPRQDPESGPTEMPTASMQIASEPIFPSSWFGIPIPSRAEAEEIFNRSIAITPEGAITTGLSDYAMGRQFLTPMLSSFSAESNQLIIFLSDNLPLTRGWVLATDQAEGMKRLEVVSADENESEYFFLVAYSNPGAIPTDIPGLMDSFTPEAFWQVFSAPVPLLLAGDDQFGNHNRIPISATAQSQIADLLRYWAAVEAGVVPLPRAARDAIKVEAAYSKYGELASGNSEDVVSITLSEGVVIFDISYCSQRDGRDTNFIASLKDSNGESVELLANEIGCGDAKKLVQIPKTGVYYLSIDSAEGPWHFSW